MSDVVSSDKRRAMMAGIGQKDTSPELTVRRWLHACGIRYRLHVRDLPGSPDLVLPKYRAVIFVHGCFWHRHSGCRLAYTPKSRTEFWEEKFRRNAARDLRALVGLRERGWRVMTIWECGLRRREGLDERLGNVLAWLKGDSPEAEVGL